MSNLNFGCVFANTRLALFRYTWGYKITSVTGALQRWVEKEGREPRSTYVPLFLLSSNTVNYIAGFTGAHSYLQF